MKSLLVPSVAVLALGCAHTVGRAPDVELSGSRCYFARTSEIYPFGSDSAIGPPPHGAWLVLRPTLHPRNDSLHLAFAFDRNGNIQDGTWRYERDTLKVSMHDLFTVNRLALSGSDPVLLGRGGGSTDQL